MSFLRLILLSIMLQSAAFGAVLVHEFAPGCNGVSTAEFVELYNTGDEPVDLAGWTLAYRGRSSSSDSGVLTLSGTIPPHGYFLITSPNYNTLVGQPINGNSLGILFPIGDLSDTGPVVVGKLSAAAGQVGLKDLSGTLVDAAGAGIDPQYMAHMSRLFPKVRAQAGARAAAFRATMSLMPIRAITASIFSMPLPTICPAQCRRQIRAQSKHPPRPGILTLSIMPLM